MLCKSVLTAHINDLASTPAHLSKIRDNVAYTNLCRLYWVFCRLTLVQGFNVARDLKIIDQIDALLGTHTDVDKIIATIQAPTQILSYFSVGLFLTRLMIDGGLLIRHTFFPNELESDSTYQERFQFEWNKRHGNFANDSVWAIVNFLTNFNHISKIPGPVAGSITASFLLFDISLILYRCNLAKEEYLLKNAQYQHEIAEYTNPAKNKMVSKENLQSCIKLLDKQKMELEVNWKNTESTFHFAAAAASLLMVGFTGSLIVSSPLLILGYYFTCQVAVSMYLTTGIYSNYNQKSLYLEQAQLSGENELTALQEYTTARNEFIYAMAKNTILPSLLIATCAFSVPAAALLTVTYIGYELVSGYYQHQQKENLDLITDEPLALCNLN